MWILFRTGAKPCFTHAGSEGQLHLNPLSSISVCSLPFYMNSSLLHKQQQALKQTYRCQCLSALGSQNHKSFSSAVTTPPGNIRIPESLPRLSTHLGTPEFLSQFHACPHGIPCGMACLSIPESAAMAWILPTQPANLCLLQLLHSHLCDLMREA